MGYGLKAWFASEPLLKGISTKDWKTGHPVSLISALPLLLALSLTPNAAGAAMEKPARTQGQMDVKVIHVDKWGVYVPNIVFYWDADMGKQKIAGLTATAEKLRNKLATIVYSVQGEIEKDKRPLVVDIAPLKEQPSIQPYEQPPVDESGNPIQGYGDGPKVYPTELLDDGLSYDAETSVDGRDGQDQSQLAAMDLTDPDSLPLVRDKPLPASSNTMVINKREVQMLVEHILHLTEKKSLDSLLYYYGDQVNYYGRGEVTKDYIRKDMGYYFKNWDTIACTLASDVVVVDTDRPDTKVVRFTSRYAVENPRKSLAGQTDNTWKVQRTATGLKVIDQKQSIIRSQP